MARPRKPLILRKLHGDTAKIGALRHQEEIESGFQSRRGRPPFPEELRFKPIPAFGLEGEALAAHRQAEAIRKAHLGVAAAHWEYIVSSLEADGIACPSDGGMLTSAALCYAMMIEAGQTGRVSAFVDLSQRYMQAADRLGLNESARAKLPRQPGRQVDEVEAALCGGLPADDSDSASVQ